jgi:hypothetical protein
MNHVPVATHDAVVAGLARITGGQLLVTVRAVGSPPTIYIGDLDEALSFHQDNDADQFEIYLIDGRHFSIVSHLFRAE